MPRPSIFGTLVVLFTLTGFLIIGAVSLFLFRTFEGYQAREQRRTLMSRLQETTDELDPVLHPDEPLSEALKEIRQSIEAENLKRLRSKFGIEVVSRSMPLLRAGSLPERKRFPPPAASVDSAEVIRSEGPDERHFLLTSIRRQSGDHTLTIYLALDDTRSAETLEDFRERTFLALFAGAMFLALSAALVARRAMRPIARITAATQQMDAGRLGEPLESHAWPAELQALATEFSSMQRRLADSFQRLSQFSADLAHELRTPVNNLLVEGEVALSQPRKEVEYRETLESMLEEVQRLRRMIDELLFLARSEHHEGSIDLTTVDVRAAAEAVAEFLSSVAEEKGISVAIEGQGSVRADPALLRRALTNLLANAIQYSHPGGRVLIQIETGATEAGIAVSDTGPGIAEIHLPHLFDRFYRVDAARSLHPEGSGLGLAIVQSIASLHGGRVTVKSSPEGTTFTLQLPSAEHGSAVI